MFWINLLLLEQGVLSGFFLLYTIQLIRWKKEELAQRVECFDECAGSVDVPCVLPDKFVSWLSGTL